MRNRTWLIPPLLCAYTFIYSLTHLSQINQITQTTLHAIFQLIPAMFFLMLLFGLANGLGLFGLVGFFLEKIANPLLHLGTEESALYFASFFSGYPTFAMLIRQSMEQQRIAPERMAHLMKISSHASPGFILITLSNGLFHNAGLALMLWIIHLAANFILAVIWRPKEKGRKLSWRSCLDRLPHPAFSRLCQKQLLTCATTFVYIFGFMLIFQVVHTAFFSKTQYAYIIHGLLEFSSGILGLAKMPLSIQFPLTAFFLGFSGLSCLMQVSTIMTDLDWEIGPFVLARLYQGSLSFGLAIIFIHIT